MSQSIDAMLAMLATSTREVFETMATPLDAKPPRSGGVMAGPCGVLGIIAFAGERSGSVSFYSSEAAAVKVTSAMTGIPEAEVNGEMPDAIGEITNMIAGTFRTRMAAAGTRWAISTPSVTIGWQLRTKHYGTVHTGLCEFTMPGGEPLFVELVLTEE